jgi:hypothetical protein
MEIKKKRKIKGSQTISQVSFMNLDVFSCGMTILCKVKLKLYTLKLKI